jgi:hypothetical protein
MSAMTGIDLEGLDGLARSLAAAATALREEAAGCSRALAGLQWTSGVTAGFERLAAAAVDRASRAADTLDDIAGALHRQGDRVDRLANDAARLATGAWQALEGLL